MTAAWWFWAGFLLGTMLGATAGILVCGAAS